VVLLVRGNNRKVYKWCEFELFLKMDDKYVNCGRFKLPLGLRVAVPVLSLYLLSLNVVEGTFKGWNCMETIRKQEVLTRKYEERIEEAERKYVGGGLDDFVGGRDGN